MSCCFSLGKLSSIVIRRIGVLNSFASFVVLFLAAVLGGAARVQRRVDAALEQVVRVGRAERIDHRCRRRHHQVVERER